MRKLFLFILITLFCVGAFAATDPVSASEDAVAYVEQLIADHPEWTEEQLEFLDALIGVVSEPWAYSPERSKRQTALVKVMVRELEALFSQEDDMKADPSAVVEPVKCLNVTAMDLTMIVEACGTTTALTLGAMSAERTPLIPSAVPCGS
jgi:hypothetical protein